MHNHNIDWDNLRYVLKVAQTGSIASAAKALAVNRTTVLRRINQFESDLDFQLFDRRGSGYALAPGADRLLNAAMEMEQKVDDLYRQIQGKAIQLEGDLRITTTDSLLISFVAPHLESFRLLHPQIKLELVITSHQLSLSRRDADIAIRPGKTIPKNLVGDKISIMHFGIYGSKAYLLSNNSKQIDCHRWLGVENPVLQSPPGQWIEANIPESCFCLKADSFLALRAAAEYDMGLCLLPVNLAKQSDNLQRVFPDQPGITNSLWIVTHPDLARSARVHAFMQHIKNVIKNSSSTKSAKQRYVESAPNGV
jgi:DNA-binding transcriptional LysR family regulator